MERIKRAKNVSLWSKDLQTLTDTTLFDMGPAFVMESKCRLKHHSSAEEDYGFGFVTIDHALNSQWIIENDEGNLKLPYASLMSLVNDGWAVD